MTPRRRGALPVGLALLSWLASCASHPTSISAKDYPRSCVSVADCIPVYEGAFGCCGGGCPNAAIREDAVAAYKAASDTATANACTGNAQPPCAPPPMCTEGRVACTAGVCELLSEPDDAAAQE